MIIIERMSFSWAFGENVSGMLSLHVGKYKWMQRQCIDTLNTCMNHRSYTPFLLCATLTTATSTAFLLFSILAYSPCILSSEITKHARVGARGKLTTRTIISLPDF